jgi:non-specific serine/threonine protein kinase
VIQRVVPLTVPDPDHRPSLKGLPRFDGVTLFVERAAAVVPGFELTEDNMVAVTRICGRLDGVPLAIELAAARLRTLSPDQILARLTDRSELLTGSFRTAPTRQQSMKLCLDWSYDLCSQAEQRAWARLSVFAGSCGLDAVEQVCTVDSAPTEIVDALSGLVDKSILIREEQGSVVRFRMLETLRDYGRSKLRESGEYQELRRRHRAWYRWLALGAEAGWIGRAQPGWIASTPIYARPSNPRCPRTPKKQRKQACKWPPRCGSSGCSVASPVKDGPGPNGFSPTPALYRSPTG